MKKTKKILALVVAYIFMIMLLPAGIIGKTAKAEESVKEMLQYSNLYVNSAVQYKDKALVSYFNEDGTKKQYNYQTSNYDEVTNYRANLSAFTEGKEKNIINGDSVYYVGYQDFIESVNNKAKVWSYKYNPDEEQYDNIYYEYNFEEDSLTEKDGFYYISDEEKSFLLEEINREFKTNYSLNQFNDYISKETESYNSKEYNIYNFGVSNNSYSVVKSDDMTLVLDGYRDISICGDNKVLSYENIQEQGNDNYNYNNTISIFSVYENGVLVKKSTIDHKRILYSYILENGCFVDLGGKSGSNIYKLNDNNEMELTDTYEGDISWERERDINNSLWLLTIRDNNKYLSKVEDGKIVEKYLVDSDMHQMSVYDDNNFILWGWGESGHKVTNVCNGKFVDLKPGEKNPSQEEPAKPEKPNTDNKDNGTIPKDTLDPNGVNNVTFENKYDVYEATTSDIEAIKNGTGSFEFVIEDSVNMSIPFKVIDKALLENAKEVKVTCEKIEDSEIIKDLKAVNKVFDLSISVEYNDGSVKSIHKFADGTVEVKLTLTDEELKGLDRSKLKVFYYNEETKKFEMMKTKVEGNDITFITNHFSKFIIAEADGNKPVKEVSSKKDNNKKKTTSSEKTTKTGDNNLTGIYFGMATLALVGMYGVVYSKRKKTNN